MYCGGAIFIDQASGYIHVEFQTTLTSHATLRAKDAYEQRCRDIGVIPQKYLSDNGTAFTSQDYRNHLINFNQIQRFAGTGAHHHNSRAERAIQTIMSISRAMLMHSALHWPDMEDTSLWPMAVSHAVYLWNHVPDPKTGLCPIDVFTKTRFEQSKLLDLHVFGCPAYVLEKSIADGKKLPRWKPRSHRCMYLGISPNHASTVPLVLNPDTGTITPQFHIVFDDWFATVTSDVEDLPDFNSEEWSKMFGDSTFQYVLDDADIAKMDDLIIHLENQTETANAQFARDRVNEAFDHLRPPTALTEPSLPLPNPTTPSAPSPPTRPSAISWGERNSVPSETASPAVPLPVQEPEPTPEPLSTERPGPQPVQLPPVLSELIVPTTTEVPSYRTPPKPAPPRVKPRKSTRNRTQATYFDPSNPLEHRGRPKRSAAARARPTILDPSGHLAAALPHDSHFSSLFAAFYCNMSVNAAGAKNNPTIFTYDQAMARDDRDKWIESAQKEIMELEKHGCWKEVPMETAKGHKIIPSQWVFRLKQRQDGTITKYKGRIVLRGDLMKDIHDVTSPVVAFSTVRIFLIMSLFLGWYSCSVDFANAFIQAKRPDKVFMHIPRGFTSKPGHCLQLIRNVYGACDGPRLWADLLFKSLKKLGFTQSRIDPCLWYRKTCFLITFVDDCGICSKTESEANKIIKELESLGFSLTKESTFAEFLGIQYKALDNGDVELTQQGLIKKVIAAAGLEECKPNRIPATEQLGKDEDGEDMKESWSYPSIIGMLLYLSTNTRPDIIFAVSQAARFTHNPKQSHATAVKTIIRYLAKTSDKGMIVKKPKTALKLDCYVDADFAGLYKVEKGKSIDSAKSRSGYIIKLGGCPLIGKSQLIPTICLSTAESEYYSLSQSMRALLPIKRLLSEFMTKVEIPANLQSVDRVVHATTHEDNTSALSLATEQRLTNRTRHYHCRWHFFWQSVQENVVEVVYCTTAEQDADYLTKPLVYNVFIANRLRVQGW